MRSVDELLRHARSHQPCQSLGPAESGGDAEADLRLSEDCVLRADAEITAHGKLAAAAQCKAVDCGNARDREDLQSAEDIVALLAEGLRFRLGHGTHCGDICAGDKRLISGAGHDQAADLLLIHAVQDLLQVVQDLAVQCVQSLRTVDGDDADLSFGLILYKAHEKHLPSVVLTMNQMTDVRIFI